MDAEKSAGEVQRAAGGDGIVPDGIQFKGDAGGAGQRTGSFDQGCRAVDRVEVVAEACQGRGFHKSGAAEVHPDVRGDAHPADALDQLHEGGAGVLREAAPDIDPDDV